MQADFYPNDLWEFSLGGVYSGSTGSFESMVLELPEETVANGDYNFSQVYTYSELDFKQFEVHGKGAREITDNASLYVGVSYFEFLDDAPFVYGDQDGQVLFTQAGFKLKF